MNEPREVRMLVTSEQRACANGTCEGHITGKDPAVICPRCETTLRHALAEHRRDALLALLAEVETTETRQDRLGAATRAPTPWPGPGIDWTSLIPDETLPPHLRNLHAAYALPKTPWPYSPAADEALDDLANTTSTWARHIAEQTGFTLSPAPIDPYADRRTTTTRAAVRWLRVHLADIRTDPAAGELAADIERVHRRIRNTIDARDLGTFVGRCPNCGANLLRFGEQTEVTCRQCKTPFKVADLEKIGLDSIRGPAAEIAEYLSTYGERVTEARLARLHRRGHLRAIVDLTKPPDEPQFYLVHAHELLQRLRKLDADESTVGQLGTPGEVSQWLRAEGVRVQVETIERWRQRARIAATSTGLVRVDDVRTMVTSVRERMAEGGRRRRVRM